MLYWDFLLCNGVCYSFPENSVCAFGSIKQGTYSTDKGTDRTGIRKASVISIIVIQITRKMVVSSFTRLISAFRF